MPVAAMFVAAKVVVVSTATTGKTFGSVCISFVIGQSQLRILLRLANMFESNELDSQVMYVFIYTHYLASLPISYIKYE